MCGSLTRHIQVHIQDTVLVCSDLAVKARRSGGKKPFLEQKTGDDFHRATGTSRKRNMVIDRENGRYRKIVTDPKTGTVLHHTDEPLSAHKGHGSAKPKNGPTKS